MTRVWLKTCPKTRNQRSGWRARVNSSVGSRRSLRRSAPAIATAWRAKVAGVGGRPASAEAGGGTAAVANVTEPSFGGGQRRAGKRREHVIEGGGRPDLSFERVGRTEGRDAARVHDAQDVAERFGLFH